jgi:hypothetical protein
MARSTPAQKPRGLAKTICMRILGKGLVEFKYDSVAMIAIRQSSLEF